MSRTWFLAFMWIARGLMLLSVADFACGLASGDSFARISGIVCLLVNALSAEFYRRRLA